MQLLGLQEQLGTALQHSASLQQDKDKLAALRAKLEADVTLLKVACDALTLLRFLLRSPFN